MCISCGFSLGDKHQPSPSNRVIIAGTDSSITSGCLTHIFTTGMPEGRLTSDITIIHSSITIINGGIGISCRGNSGMDSRGSCSVSNILSVSLR